MYILEKTTDDKLRFTIVNTDVEGGQFYIKIKILMIDDRKSRF